MDAQTSTSTSTSTTNVRDERQQAGPLPPKRGEIGYREDIHEQAQQRSSDNGEDPSVVVPVLPLRHPADRDPLPSPRDDSMNPIPSSAAPLVDTTNRDPDSSSNRSYNKPNGKNLIYFGVRLTTLVFLTLQITFLATTIALWVVSAIHFSKNASYQAPPTSSSSSSSSPPPTSKANPTFGVLIHASFGILVVGQLVFLERRIYYMRAEWFTSTHLHPLPSSSRPASSQMPIAPWNRPPLPTYAATLAQSGVGTGDVEDHLIATPPPPAYGNTRGSTLLLAAALRNSLGMQQQQRPVSLRSQRSRRHSGHSVLTDRPVSYRTTDEALETMCDAERSRRLEETLAALERSQSRLQRNEMV